MLVGSQAGAALTTGSNNTVLGAHAGTAALANAVVLADGAGTVRMRWDNANNAVQTVDAVAPTLTADNTMAFVYNAAQQGLNVLVRAAGATYTLELTNERMIGTHRGAPAVHLPGP